MAWVEHKRTDNRRGMAAPLISFRSNGIGFNATLMRAAHITGAYRVVIYFDDERQRLGVRFTKGKSDGFALIKEVRGIGRFLQSATVLRTPQIAAAIARGATKFRAHKDGEGIWYINLEETAE